MSEEKLLELAESGEWKDRANYSSRKQMPAWM